MSANCCFSPRHSCRYATRRPAQVPADLQAASRARIIAIAKADSATWDRLTSDSFTVFGVNNHVLTKAQRLAGLKQQTPGAPATLPTSTGSARREPRASLPDR